MADTVHPNVGLQLFPVRGGPARLTVCASGASIEANPCCIEDGVVDSRTAPSWGRRTRHHPDRPMPAAVWSGRRASDRRGRTR